jgi:hypothetical protein
MLRDGQLIDNNRIVIEGRYNRAGRWSPKADEEENDMIKRMNVDIRAWNEDIRTNTKVKGKSKYDGERLKLGTVEEIPEIVFKRTIHVHDVGLKRVHNKSRWLDYFWFEGNEPRRCNRLIETIPAGNYKTDGNRNKVINWDMSAPRMPEWLNKADEAATEDEEIGIEVSYSTLCYDGESETPMDRYEDM